VAVYEGGRSEDLAPAKAVAGDNKPSVVSGPVP